MVYELGAHAINLGIRCYVKSADWFGTKVTLLEQLKLGYDKAGINIPTRSRTCICTCTARMAAWLRPTRWCATSRDPAVECRPAAGTTPRRLTEMPASGWHYPSPSD